MQSISLADLLTQELHAEADTCRRFMDAIPEDKLTWKASDKSHTLGGLAMHLAEIIDGVSEMATHSVFEAQNIRADFKQPQSLAEVHRALDAAVEAAAGRISRLSNEQFMEDWRLVAGEDTIVIWPRYQVLRGTMLNHIVHHRGQMGVYLRLVGATVPWCYGPSGDEAPNFPKPEVEPAAV